ncbi:14315_t:CDS:2, partial [Racocetra persica]
NWCSIADAQLLRAFPIINGKKKSNEEDMTKFIYFTQSADNGHNKVQFHAKKLYYGELATSLSASSRDHSEKITKRGIALIENKIYRVLISWTILIIHLEKCSRRSLLGHKVVLYAIFERVSLS